MVIKLKMNSQKSSINILTLLYYLNNLNVSYLFKEIGASEMEKMWFQIKNSIDLGNC